MLQKDSAFGGAMRDALSIIFAFFGLVVGLTSQYLKTLT